MGGNLRAATGVLLVLLAGAAASAQRGGAPAQSLPALSMTCPMHPDIVESRAGTILERIDDGMAGGIVGKDVTLHPHSRMRAANVANHGVDHWRRLGEERQLMPVDDQGR